MAKCYRCGKKISFFDSLCDGCAFLEEKESSRNDRFYGRADSDRNINEFDCHKERLGSAKDCAQSNTGGHTALDRANITIRKANERIGELKRLVEDLQSEIALRDQEMLGSVGDLGFCEILGVRQEASLADAKANYKRLCQIYHPDKTRSQKMQKIINAAYEEARERLKDK